MGSSERKFTVQQWLQMFGLPYDPNDPLASSYGPIVSAARVNGELSPDFEWFAEANLRARAVLYYKNTPGDCGTNTPAQIGGAQGLKIAGLGLSTAQSFTGMIPALAGTTASTVLGAVTAGFGLLLGPIMAIFQHHAQAVQQEQQTLCQFSAQATQIIQQIDQSVRSGQITPAAGIADMTALVQQSVQGLATIEKTCNAACYYLDMMNAHQAFAAVYYPSIAPSGVGGIEAGVSNLLTGSNSWIIIAVLGLIVLFFIFRGMRK